MLAVSTTHLGTGKITIITTSLEDVAASTAETKPISYATMQP